MESIMTIGIAGGTGSGKTTITREICREFGDAVSVIYHDNYYKAHDELSYEERTKLNYDHPNSFETDLLCKHLSEIKKGNTIKCPVYDYSIHNRTAETIEIKPSRVVILEGILIFQDKELCNQLDIKIFVDTDADVRILRRIVRDVRDRGRNLESVVDQYLATVKPMHEKYVEPSRKNADIVVPEGGHNRVALDMVLRNIKMHLEKGRK